MPRELWWGGLSILAGICFSLMTLAYEAGRMRRVAPPLIIFSVGIVGMLVFGCRWVMTSHGAPAFSKWVFLGGVLAGLAQGGAVQLIGPARQRGPFTPINAALNLMFVPTALYAVLFLRQPLNGLTMTGLCLAAVCVVAGSQTTQQPPTTGALPDHKTRWKALQARLEYLGILCLLIGAVGVSGIIMQDLSARLLEPGITWFDRFHDCFYFALYGGLIIPCVGHFVRFMRAGVSFGDFAWLGLLAGFGSTAGFFLLVYAARLPAGIGFASACVSTILSGAVICALLFGEPRNRAWYVSATCAVLAVLCFNLRL